MNFCQIKSVFEDSSESGFSDVSIIIEVYPVCVPVLFRDVTEE